MRSWRLWLLWFVLQLWDARRTDTNVYVFKRPKGGEGSVTCRSGQNPNVTRWVFCKNDCEEGDVLVQTSGSEQTNGRFSIKQEKKGSSPHDLISVTISNLTLSDSGRYRCFWDRPVGSFYAEFRIEVIDGAESKSEISLAAGEDFSQTLFFFNPGNKKTFCRNRCSEEDILVMMTGDEGQSGRYRIQHKKHAGDLSEVTVTIRNVSSTDSGAYQVHLDQSSHQVWISVSSAPPGGFPVTVRPSEAPPEQEPTGRPEISVSSAPPGGFPVTVRPSEAPPEQEPTGRPDPNTQNLTMILVLIPVCIVVIITVITLTICWKRRKRTDRGTGAGGTQNPEREYENICPESASENV